MRQIEVLTFVRRGTEYATVVTDDERTKSFELKANIVKDHVSLSRAIAYLEAHGYTVDTGAFAGTMVPEQTSYHRGGHIEAVTSRGSHLGG